MDIDAWLKELGLECYAAAFAANDIDAAALRTLDADDLKELGVTSLGHRKKLLTAIAALPATHRQPQAVPAESGAAERRQLTVLLIDLVGSTELAGRLDPEDLGVVMRSYQERCAEAVTRWGGQVAKYMGDGVLAYFGWPQAHEEDAERAVRAGLELVDAIHALPAPTGERLAVRVGIATGQVVVGDLIGEGAAREETVVGETPNLAARLQGLATPGSVVISHGTRRLVGDLFELMDLGAHSLKGFAEPVQAWRVLGEGRAEGRFEALRGAQVTPLIGREHELALLLERWNWARDGEGHAVMISGEAGIGKSRLVRAVRERLANARYTSLSHFCSPHHSNSALHPVIGLLERAAGFRAEDAPAQRLDKLAELLAQSTDRLDEAVPLVAALLSIPLGDRYPPLDVSPQQQKQRTLDVLADQLAGLAAGQPVLAIYEDIHWIDPTTLELLDLVVERVRRLPVLVLVTSRPGFDVTWVGQRHVTQLPLSRLGGRQAIGIVERLTGGKPLPEEVLDQIVAKTDGIPLFVEELTKTVLESGLLRDSGDRYALVGPLLPLAIPATLQDSLMARLDRLVSIKEVAQIGAVIGREFSYRLLAAVADMPEERLHDALDRLAAAELVYRRGTPPETTYSFKHALVQDVAYQSLLKARRQQLHGRIAQSLEEQFPRVCEHEPEVLAHHYTRADLPSRAISFWLSAGRRAAERSADLEADAHLSRALELLARLPESAERAAQELELRVALGPVLMNLKGSAAPEVAAEYERARELGPAVGRPEHAFQVLWGLWINRNMSGRLQAAQEYARELIEVAEELPKTVFRLQAHHAMWTTRDAAGELALAFHHVEQGLGIYDPDRHASSAFVYGGHDAGVCGYATGALMSWKLGYPARALELARSGVAVARRLRHPFTTAHALCYRTILHQLRGETGAVAEGAEELLAHCAEHRLEIWSSNGDILKGWALVARGRIDEGLPLLEQAIDRRRTTGVVSRQPYYLAILAEALGAAARPERGLEIAAESLELVHRTQDFRWEAIAICVQGDLLCAVSGRGQEAEAALRRAIAVARRQEAKSFELRAATNLARLWADRDERQQAYDLLAPIHGWFTEGFETVDLRGAEALLEALD